MRDLRGSAATWGRESLCHCRVVAVGWQGTAGGDVVGPGKLAAQERQDTGCMVVLP